ncbi:MAG: hypothetical protein JJU03_09200 [Idiomarina sp.]|nr:hypothetical protein [Idiomarina sp.]
MNANESSKKSENRPFSFLVSELNRGLIIILSLIGVFQVLETLSPGFSALFTFISSETFTQLSVLVAILLWLSAYGVLLAFMPVWDQYKKPLSKFLHFIFAILTLVVGVQVAGITQALQKVQKQTDETILTIQFRALERERQKVRNEMQMLESAIVDLCRHLDEPCRSLPQTESNDNYTGPTND